MTLIVLFSYELGIAHGRRRSGLSKDGHKYLEPVVKVVNDLGDYWPLTLRQVYYQLVAAGVIENNKPQYKKLSRVLTKARIAGIVPWPSIEDRSRVNLVSGGWRDQGEFLREETDNYLSGYRRDLLQSQDVALEVWVEKDALSRVCHNAARPYCVPVVVGRGFSSISYVYEASRRIRAHGHEGKKTIILYFGDLDPSGWEMLPSMMDTLNNEMGVCGQVDGLRCALNVEQVSHYELPHNPDAIKFGDSRAKKYVAEFGRLAVELDALPPVTLENLVKQSIESRLDMDLFEAEKIRQGEEIDDLEAIKSSVEGYLSSEHGNGEQSV